MILEEKKEYWSETFEGLDYSEMEIADKEFDGCKFVGCNFSDSTFKRCNFVDCEFTKCNLSLVKIEYSKFADVVFNESKLIGINWIKVSWPRMVFTAPLKFYKSILNDNSFFELSLPELIIEECKAHNVDFRGGDFSRANFTYTDLTGCVFVRTNLSGADFSEATNYDIDIYENNIKQAKFSRFEAVSLLDSLDIELVD
ncbi:MAG: pentapeptide repeat-containing protein [Pseudomonadales bacterium]